MTEIHHRVVSGLGPWTSDLRADCRLDSWAWETDDVECSLGTLSCSHVSWSSQMTTWISINGDCSRSPATKSRQRWRQLALRRMGPTLSRRETGDKQIFKMFSRVKFCFSDMSSSGIWSTLEALNTRRLSPSWVAQPSSESRGTTIFVTLLVARETWWVEMVSDHHQVIIVDERVTLFLDNCFLL